MGYRLLGETARLYLRNDEIAETAISIDKNMIQRATFTRVDAIQEEVIAAAWVIDSMLELRSLERRNAGATLIHIIQGQLAGCLYRFNYRREAADTADNGLILELANAQNLRHEFYVDMLTGILGASCRQTRTIGPAVNTRTRTRSVDACIEENLDFDRIEAASFLRELAVVQEIADSKAVADAAVEQVGLRQTHRASSDEIDNAVTALADRQEAYRTACGATDRADMVLIAEIRNNRRHRQDSWADRVAQQHQS